MAGKGTTPFRNTFTTAGKGAKEAAERQSDGLQQRKSSAIILDPNDVAGEYDASRLLTTTMGNMGVRSITQDDLVQFRANARQLGKKFKGGITAAQIIDHSSADRRERAHEQIKTAFPQTRKAGRVQFQTAAGPGSVHKRHYVTVEFANYAACVASPKLPMKVVDELTKGQIKVDCDCEDWRYRYRFIATAGRYAAGPWLESGFPKLTNPNLKGVACKHVLRVAALIKQSPTFKNYAAAMIESGRASVVDTRQSTKVADAEKFAEKLKSESHRQRRIVHSEDIRSERARWADKRAQAGLMVKASAKAKERQDNKTKSVASATKAAEMNIRKLVSLGALNQEQADSMLFALRSKA